MWISPGSLRLPVTTGLFAGFPPTFIQCGGVEMTVDCMRTLRDRLVADIGEDRVTYLEFPDATHIVMGFSWHEPECSEAYKAVGAWYGSLKLD